MYVDSPGPVDRLGVLPDVDGPVDRLGVLPDVEGPVDRLRALPDVEGPVDRLGALPNVDGPVDRLGVLPDEDGPVDRLGVLPDEDGPADKLLVSEDVARLTPLGQTNGLADVCTVTDGLPMVAVECICETLGLPTETETDTSEEVLALCSSYKKRRLNKKYEFDILNLKVKGFTGKATGLHTTAL